MDQNFPNDAEQFVTQKLTDKKSHIINGYVGDDLFQFEYKVKKSEAAQNLELHENALLEIPKWVVFFSIPIIIFLLAFFIGALVTMGNLQPDALYGQSCSDRSCSKKFDLKCINKTCQCEEPKYYRNKCVDLSKFGETCSSRDNCDPIQDMICIGSICSCEPTKYWNPQLKKCVDRLSNGQVCSGDQCKIRINLVCGELGLCKCVDETLYFWDENKEECFPKKKYSLPCNNDNQCLDSELTVCKNNQYCLCTENEYFNGTNCNPRIGEFESCTFDAMCLKPMFCTSTIGCTCTTFYYFDPLYLSCVEQKSIDDDCSANHHCREDKQLLCYIGKCICKSKYSWSESSDECKLTYLQGNCQSSAQCNSDEGLICAKNTNCNCPDTSIVGYCDCIRQRGNEKYWNSSQCVNAHAYDESCEENFQCKTMTELTKCIDKKCDCEKVGGFTSWKQCKKCLDDDDYFNDMCYYFSKNVQKNSKAVKECPKHHKDAKLLVIETEEELDFIFEKVEEFEVDKYWISGRRTKWPSSVTYTWRPSVILPVRDCNLLSRNENCLYFHRPSECYKSNEHCSNKLPYICEY